MKRHRSWPYHGAEVYEIADHENSRFILKRHQNREHYTAEVTAYTWMASLTPGCAPQLIADDPSLLALITTLIPGTPLDELPNGSPDEHEAYSQAGALLRQFHAITSGETDSRVVTRLRAKSESALAVVSGLLTHSELAIVRLSADDLEEISGQLPAVATHGDYLPRNLLWHKPSRQLAVIDFEKAALAPSGRDLALMTNQALSARADLQDAFYEGFGTSLGDAELAALRAFSVLNAIISFAWGNLNGDTAMALEARQTLAQ